LSVCIYYEYYNSASRQIDRKASQGIHNFVLEGKKKEIDEEKVCGRKALYLMAIIDRIFKQVMMLKLRKKGYLRK
jgi:hypothetical protein